MNMGLNVSRGTWLMAALLCGLLLAACSGPSEEADSEPGVFERTLDDFLGDSSLSEQMRAVLLDIQEQGEVSFEVYQVAAHHWVDCVTDLGLEMRLIETFNEGQIRFASGIRFPSDITSEDDPRLDSLTAAADECRRLHFMPVEFLYLSQPSALELRERYFEQFREQTWECLRELGHGIDRDASRTEFQEASNAVAESSGMDCLYQAGYYDSGSAFEDW